jgi:hypothetical protein
MVGAGQREGPRTGRGERAPVCQYGSRVHPLLSVSREPIIRSASSDFAWSSARDYLSATSLIIQLQQMCMTYTCTQELTSQHPIDNVRTPSCDYAWPGYAGWCQGNSEPDRGNIGKRGASTGNEAGRAEVSVIHAAVADDGGGSPIHSPSSVVTVAPRQIRRISRNQTL